MTQNTTLADQLEATAPTVTDAVGNKFVSITTEMRDTIISALRHSAGDAGTFPRIVTHEQALQAAKNLIDAHFNNRDGKGVLTSIPARPEDDDLTLMDYIKQQRATSLTKPTTEPSEYRRGVEDAAKVIQRRMNARFDENGVREPDTNHCYYPGSAGETYEALDEEGEALIAAIRQQAEAQGDGA